MSLLLNMAPFLSFTFSILFLFFYVDEKTWVVVCVFDCKTYIFLQELVHVVLLVLGLQSVIQVSSTVLSKHSHLSFSNNVL